MSTKRFILGLSTLLLSFFVSTKIGNACQGVIYGCGPSDMVYIAAEFALNCPPGSCATFNDACNESWIDEFRLCNN